MWEQVSAINKTVSEQWSEAATAHQKGSIEEANHHDQEGWRNTHQAYGLISAYFSEREDKAKIANKTEEAAAWHEAVETSQLAITAVDHLRQLSLTPQPHYLFETTQMWRDVVFTSYYASFALIQNISKTGEEATTWKAVAQGKIPAT